MKNLLRNMRKLTVQKLETKDPKNGASFPRLVSNSVSKIAYFVSTSPEEETGNGDWEMRNRFPHIPSRFHKRVYRRKRSGFFTTF
jgi:hypothetical protein